MTKRARQTDWGFPRWRPYGASSEAARVKLCDRDGCAEPGLHRAPKAPNRPESWWFCAPHAAEYNGRWDYFSGLDAAAAAEHAAEMGHEQSYARSKHYAWAEDGTRPKAERDALSVLELDEDADETAVKGAHRRLAKQHHPDANPGDDRARQRFLAVQAAYEVLTRAAARPRT